MQYNIILVMKAKLRSSTTPDCHVFESEIRHIPTL